MVRSAAQSAVTGNTHFNCVVTLPEQQLAGEKRKLFSSSYESFPLIKNLMGNF